VRGAEDVAGLGAAYDLDCKFWHMHDEINSGPAA
jgi:hypothetical protein